MRLMVFEIRILMPTFGPQRDVNAEWRRLDNEEFHSSHSLLNIIRVIKYTRLKWIGHVA